MLTVVADGPTRMEAVPSVLDELVREGARRMLAAALEAEVEAYVEAPATERDAWSPARRSQRACRGANDHHRRWPR